MGVGNEYRRPPGSLIRPVFTPHPTRVTDHSRRDVLQSEYLRRGGVGRGSRRGVEGSGPREKCFTGDSKKESHPETFLRRVRGRLRLYCIYMSGGFGTTTRTEDPVRSDQV